MLSSFKAQLALPTAAAYAKATTVDAKLKGSSLNSAVYILEPANFSSLAGVAQMQQTTALTRRNPGQAGSNRAQILSQAVILDVNGRPHVISYNQTLTVTNYIVPPAGVVIDKAAVAEAVVAMGLGYTLNPLDSTTAGTQNDVITDLINGIIP